MPKATVITPNYNHARYLPQRLDGILAQTFGDFELIVLDNASTDGSRAVIESYVARDPRVRAVFNEVNNGSPYKQWNLGLGQARGEYVWIAESDDYAEPTLLETLVGRLEANPRAGLAMCQSWIVDEEGRKLFDYRGLFKYYHECQDYDLARWDEDFDADGRDYCRHFMYPLNTICNASAVVFRRRAIQGVGGAPEKMKLCADWMTYVNIMLEWDIAFVSAHLNYFRKHQATTRVRSKRDTYLRESLMVQRRVDRALGLGEGDRYFVGRLHHEVGWMIGEQRRPPHNKVPIREALWLLVRAAKIDRRILAMSARMLGREALADLARRLGVLAAVRKIKDAVGAGRAAGGVR